MIQIITWKRKKVNDFCYKDPNTDDRVNTETGGVTTFTETPYQLEDGRFISLVEYPDDTTEENIEHFKNLDPDFEFTFIDEPIANTLLAELGGNEQGQYITISNYIFTNNTPEEEY